MKRDAVKDLIYGGLTEITKNNKYYYSSSVGSNYNHLTETGKEVITEFMEEMIRVMHKTEHAELDQRAKDMVMDNLKGK